MTPQLKGTLTKALRQLKIERAKLDRQITAIQYVLKMSNDVVTRARPKMSAAARKAVGKRMKRYWQERRKTSARSQKTNTVDQKKS